MNLKDIILADIDDVFLDLDELSEMVNIDGVEIVAVIERTSLKQRTMRQDSQYDGIYKAEMALYVKESDLGYRPVFGQSMQVNGKFYLVAECSEENGMLEVILGANES